MVHLCAPSVTAALTENCRVSTLFGRDLLGAIGVAPSAAAPPPHHRRPAVQQQLLSLLWTCSVRDTAAPAWRLLTRSFLQNCSGLRVLSLIQQMPRRTPKRVTMATASAVHWVEKEESQDLQLERHASSTEAQGGQDFEATAASRSRLFCVGRGFFG